MARLRRSACRRVLGRTHVQELALVHQMPIELHRRVLRQRIKSQYLPVGLHLLCGMIS